MDYLNSLGYKWVHYGAELFGNHVRRIDGIGIGRDNWPPQGNRNTAAKLLSSVWLIDSVTEYADEPDDAYYCWFFTSIDHELHIIFYTWIKGDIRPYKWTFRGEGKNAALIFDDSWSADKPPRGYYEGGKHIIPIESLIIQIQKLRLSQNNLTVLE